MIAGFNEVLSKEAALGIGLYVAAAYLAAGPISERIAVRDHLPQCVSQTTTAAARPSEAQDDAGIAVDLFLQTTQRLPGPLSDMLSGAVTSATQLAANAKRKRTEAEAATAPDRCRCMIALALAETRTEWAYFVGSLKLYQPPAIPRFGDVIARADRNNICGRRA